MAYTNQVLENSGLAHRQIRLAGLVNVADRDPSLIDYPDVDRERRIRFKDLLAALRAEYQTDVTMFYRHTGGGNATGGYTNDPSYRSYCALNPNPALCYYNVRKETWGTDIDDSRAIKAGAGYVNVGSLGLHASRTFSHEWGHEMAIRHDRYAWNTAVDDHRILRPMAYGHTYAHYLPGQDIPEWCQGTIMSYFTQCHDDERLRPPHIPPVLGVPNFSNPQIYYPRPKTSDFARIGWDDVEGPGASHPDVPMGVPGDQRTMALDGPADAARAIDEVWNIVADLSEPPFERLAGACNEGDMAADALASRLPARVAVTFADGGGKTYRPPVSGPAMCLDDVSLKGRSSNAAFDVATSDRGGERRLSVVATEPHYGACASSKRAVVAAELWDAVEEFPPEVIRQRVPGVSPAHLVVEQRSARSFCKGAPARHHLRRLGDFDGDGRADALLRHADGHWRYQPMDERGARAGSAASLNNNPAVSVAGVGDFNGDGRDDVLMRRADGSWRAYLMDGRRSIAGGGSVALPRDGWVDGIGDFNGDGKDDVLLQHEDGRRHYYPMDGRTVLQGGEVGIHEVTFAQWDACVAAGGCDGYTPVIFHEEEARANRPVDAMNWQDAQNYAAWLSAHTGQTYRLPSEAEWEYAARAGTQTPYHFGATISPDQANYTYDVDTVVGTVPVGSFPANAWALHDVHGNVAEWTQDCYDPSQWTYDGAPTDGSAREEGDCAKRVTRGGSWADPPEELRSASRGLLWRADSRIGVNGIRVVRELGD